MRHAVRVDPDDACGLAPRLPGGERQVHLEVCAVDRVAERVEKRRVALEGADRLGAFVLVGERERDVVLELLGGGIPGEKGLLDDTDAHEWLELSPGLCLSSAFGGRRLGLGLHATGVLLAGPRQQLRYGHGVARQLRRVLAVPEHLEECAGVADAEPHSVAGFEHGIELATGHARRKKRVVPGPGLGCEERARQEAGDDDLRGPRGYAHGSPTSGDEG